jgi:hypothetical protein
MQIVAGEGPQNKWIYMVLQELYVTMALTGIGIGLAIAFVVLLLATRNLITATLCIITIGCVLVCVMGSTVAMGWQLGSVEALCFMTLTGFAVDYVVHLAHSYMAANTGSSLERTHAALQEMGISVFWGMATSFIASLVLATCQLQVRTYNTREQFIEGRRWASRYPGAWRPRSSPRSCSPPASCRCTPSLVLFLSTPSTTEYRVGTSVLGDIGRGGMDQHTERGRGFITYT